nr:retrotransposon protein, putative, unclassified [Tanacetum cinerariifolium]
PQPQPQPSQDARISMNLLQNLMDTCITLTRRVEHLEHDKVSQALEITKLKSRVKKLERRNKASKLMRLKKVRSAQNEDVVLEDAKDVAVEKSVDEEELDLAELQEVVDVVTIAKIITKVVTTASTTITAADVPIPAAPTLTAAPSRRRKGVVIRDPKETTTTSTIIHSKAKSKDKGKGILRKQKEDKTVKRYQALKRKPQTKAQARKNIMIYLRNVVGFKMDYFKGMSYDDIRLIFKKHFDSNVAFLQKTKEQMDEEDSKALKRLNESQEEKAAKNQIYMLKSGKIKEVFMVKKKSRVGSCWNPVMLNNVRLEVEEESEVSLELLSVRVKDLQESKDPHYGFKQAPRAWYDELSKFLTSKGFTKGKIDTTLFTIRYREDILLVQIYVDDIIFGCTNPKFSKRFEKLMHGRFEMSLMGEMKFFLGLQIHQSPRGIFINQLKYALEILHKHGMEKGQSIGTPMAMKPKLDADLSGNPVDQTDYHSKIRSLIYLTSSRLDIVQAGSIFGLTAFLDPDHAGCIDTRKSTSGGIQFLGDTLVSWMYKKQDCTTMSSAEAEYVVLSISYAQVIWMRTQLQDYGLNYNNIPLYYDSQSGIAISCNPVQHSRTKHVHTRYHFIKERVENGIIELYFVRTEYQLADMFTKALPKDRFKYLVRRIGMKCLTPAELEVLAKKSA